MRFRKIIFAALLFCLLPVVVAEAADSELVRLGVMSFTSKADGVSNRQAEIITDIFTRTLSNSKSIVLLERERLDMIGKEHGLNMSGLVDMGMAVEVGRLAGLQYMLLGSVTGLDEKVSGGAFLYVATGSRVAEATIDMRVVDVTTGEIILSLVQKGSSTHQTQAVSIGGITTAESEFGDLKARAVADAAARLGHKIREELAGEYSQVISVSGKTVNINIGATSGAQKGDLYLVYADGTEVLDIDGTSLGREKHPIAVVRVQSVSGGFSVCEAVKDGGKIDLVSRGDKVEPIASRESQELAKKKRFPSERPRRRAYDETAEQLFSGKANDTPGAEQEPVSPFPDPAPAASAAPAAPVASNQALENESTDPGKVVGSYPLNPGDKNFRRVGHINAGKLKGKQAYDAFVELAESYKGDYLAAFKAGDEALKLKKSDDALKWYNNALAINPNYRPAIDARAKLQ